MKETQSHHTRHVRHSATTTPVMSGSCKKMIGISHRSLPPPAPAPVASRERRTTYMMPGIVHGRFTMNTPSHCKFSAMSRDLHGAIHSSFFTRQWHTHPPYHPTRTKAPGCFRSSFAELSAGRRTRRGGGLAQRENTRARRPVATELNYNHRDASQLLQVQDKRSYRVKVKSSLCRAGLQRS